MKKRFFTPIYLALSMLKKSKLRSGLTVFGIMIGIAMVIIVMSAGQGVKGLILDQVSSFGNNWIDIEPKIPQAKNSFASVQGRVAGVSITTMTLGDAKDIKTLPDVTSVYGALTSQAVISYQNQKMRPIIYGVSPSYIDIDRSTIELGHFFDVDQDNRLSQVAVLGSEVRDNLFGNKNPIGKRIHINGHPYEVIGVMASVGSSGFFNKNDMIYIPIQTVQHKIMGIHHILAIIAQIKPKANANIVAQEITLLMRSRHKITDSSKDDFSVTTMNEALTQINIIIGGITWLLIALAGISLLVGGVGIMNVMYVSVAERTFEIGLRKAVGASEGDILWQFLVESVIMTFIGGVIGILIGVSISYLIFIIVNLQGLVWLFAIPISSIILSTLFSLVVGLIFGVYPARKAAELDPIVAIKQE